jgi:hypothetical protein
MGMSYTIDRERRLVRSRLWGAVSTADFVDLFSRIVIDPRFEPHFRALTDLREVTAISGDTMSVGTIASIQVYLPGTRRAVVASRDEVVDLLRTFATYSQRFGQLVRVFADMDEAQRWVEGAEIPAESAARDEVAP